MHRQKVLHDQVWRFF